MNKTIDWQELANELSDAIRELSTALDNYNTAFNKADDARKQIEGDEMLDGFADAWNEAEGSIMAIEEQRMELAAFVDFIEEKLA
jgi:hypothetical protein